MPRIASVFLSATLLLLLSACAISLYPIEQASIRQCRLVGCEASGVLSDEQSSRLHGWLNERKSGWLPSSPFEKPQIEVMLVAGAPELPREVVFGTPVFLQVNDREVIFYRKAAYKRNLSEAERSELLSILKVPMPVRQKPDA